MENSKSQKKAVKKNLIKKTTVKRTITKKEAVKPSESEIKPQKTLRKKPVVASKTPESLSASKTTSPAVPTRMAQADRADVSKPIQTQPPIAPGQNVDLSNYWQDQYGDNRIVLLIRDPYWCFTYWDLSGEKQAEIIRELNTSGRKTKLILRVYDVTDVEFDGTNAHRTMDIEVTDEATNWYINVWSADRSYCVDLGLLYPDGRFFTLARSNVVTTPRDSVSSVIDEEWMVVDETFDQLYHAAGAGDFGRSSEALMKYMLKRVRADVTSGGLASMGSEGGRPRPARPEDFWLIVNTELIVYGATEPDASVTIQEKPLRLNPDGTFSVRFALPDGKQVIPVKAVNAAGTQERQITPVVEKKTE